MSLFMFGPRHVPRGASAFGLAGFGMQWAWDEVQGWRRREAAKIMRKEQVTDAMRGTPREEGSATEAGDSSVHALGADRNPHVPTATAPAWLPFTTDKATADARRLRRLKARLAEIDEQLGIGAPGEAVDSRMREVWELEKRAGGTRR